MSRAEQRQPEKPVLVHWELSQRLVKGMDAWRAERGLSRVDVGRLAVREFLIREGAARDARADLVDQLITEHGEDAVLTVRVDGHGATMGELSATIGLDGVAVDRLKPEVVYETSERGAITLEDPESPAAFVLARDVFIPPPGAPPSVATVVQVPLSALRTLVAEEPTL